MPADFCIAGFKVCNLKNAVTGKKLDSCFEFANILQIVERRSLSVFWFSYYQWDRCHFVKYWSLSKITFIIWGSDWILCMLEIFFFLSSLNIKFGISHITHYAICLDQNFSSAFSLILHKIKSQDHPKIMHSKA